MKFIPLFILLFPVYSIATSVSDSIPSSQHQSIFSNDTTIPDDVKSDTLTTINKGNEKDSVSSVTRVAGLSTQKSVLDSSAIIQTSPVDSTYTQPSLFFGIGAGFTLGNFPIFDLWQKRLPSDLAGFGLSAKSYSKEIDTTNAISVLPIDTSTVYFKIIDLPNLYNMTFPVQLSIVRFNGSNRFVTSASFSMINKQLKASIFSKEDSIQNKIDIIQKLALYSVTLDLTYGRKIPLQYFSIEKVNRSDFVIGLGITPLLSIKETNKLNDHSSNQRFINIADTITSQLQNRSYLGLAGSLKAGISSVRNLSPTAALSIDILYTLNVYNYIYSNGSRVQTTDFDKDSKDKSPLSFISNRFDIRFSLLRTRSRKSP